MDFKDLFIVSATEAAEMLQISRKGFHKMVKKHKIPFKSLSCGRIFWGKDIENLQEKRKPNLKHKQKKSCSAEERKISTSSK